MSEMLGNQYFLARRYTDALSELKIELEKNPSNHSARKKLIICFMQTNQFEKAFKSFYNVVQNNISVITNTDPKRDNCPCPDIIEQMLPELSYTTEDEHFIKLGMLYLYCDINDSIKHFERVSPKHSLYNEVQQIISKEKSQLTIIN